MGAAGGVTIYKLADLEVKYAELWPNNNIHGDWWYLKTITADLDGTKWVLDYADDQGMNEGSGNNFWFNTDEIIDRPEGFSTWESRDVWKEPGKVYASHYRVLTTLRQLNGQRVEVWT